MTRLHSRMAGFSLVEATLAVLLLAIGLLAVSALLAQTARTFDDARRLQVATASVAALADSIALFGSSGDGARPTPWGSVSWSEVRSGAGATVRFVAWPADSSRPPLVDVSVAVRPHE